MQKHFYGYKPDQMDFRDLEFKPKVTAPVQPQTVHLSDKYLMPPVVDQGQLGSCTGNGIAAIVYFNLLNKHLQQSHKAFQPSRLFIYYNERVIENTVKSDAGAQIRDGIKSVANIGVCAETTWKYNVDKFAVKPTVTAFKNALKFTALTYSRIDNKSKLNLISALLSGYPIVFGFTVYESFESEAVAATGVVPMPSKTEALLGGHCVYMVGYDAPTDRFICVNSWGTGWGKNGTFTMPAAYLTNPNLADDFWIINTIL